MARKEQGRVPKRLLRGRMPRLHFDLDGRRFHLEKVLKQDFFAATGRYVADDGTRAVLKHYHTEPFLTLPLGWAGELMAAREIHHHRLLADCDRVPRLLGRLDRSGVVHAWAEGKDLLDLAPGERLAADFFARLEALVAAVHARGMAYVDMNKPDNVLVGDDGGPLLIDFQIAYAPIRSPLTDWLTRPLLRLFQEADRYHVEKLKRRYAPEQLTDAERARGLVRPWFLDLHRLVAAPLRDLRRHVLVWLGTR